MKTRNEKQETESELRYRINGYLKKLADEHSIIWRWDMAGTNDDDTDSKVSTMNLNATSKGWPDLFIIAPKAIYPGLFLELKREGTYINSLLHPSTAHGKQQLHMINRLEAMGYAAAFGIGYADTRSKILNFIKGGRVAPVVVTVGMVKQQELFLNS